MNWVVDEDDYSNLFLLFFFASTEKRPADPHLAGLEQWGLDASLITESEDIDPSTWEDDFERST